MQISSPLVWFITGTSQGFGLELVRAALERGDKVIATSRTPEKIQAIFPNLEEQLLVLSVDLTDGVQVKEAVVTALAQFGHVDVLVNNAGHGLLGAVEESDPTEILELFQINVFALMRVTKAFLPHFRKRKSGHIVNISSIAGLTSGAGLGIYSATKFAVEGFSMALAQEVAPLGIKVTIVEPGGFRTEFLGASLKTTSKIIDAYAATVGAKREWKEKTHGKQLGDPILGAKFMVKAITSDHPPLHLLLGSDAYERANKQLSSLHEEFEAWKELTFSTDIKE